MKLLKKVKISIPIIKITNKEIVILGLLKIKRKNVV